MKSVVNSGKVMMSSLEICEAIKVLSTQEGSGVVEKTHDNILRDIKEQINFSNNISVIKNDGYIVELYEEGFNKVRLNKSSSTKKRQRSSSRDTRHLFVGRS